MATKIKSVHSRPPRSTVHQKTLNQTHHSDEQAPFPPPVSDPPVNQNAESTDAPPIRLIATIETTAPSTAVPVVDQVRELASIPTQTPSENSKSEEVQVPPSIPPTSSSSKRHLGRQFVWLLAIVAFLGGIGICGTAIVNIFVSGKPPIIPTPTSVKAPPPTAPPTLIPTLTPVPDRAKVSIKVLNGSGTPGLAGKVKVYLETFGYRNIETANAEKYDYQNTEVSIKEEKRFMLETLLSDLRSNYPVSTSAGTLVPTDKFDAVIIVGKK